jgi:hypothetical protein
MSLEIIGVTDAAVCIDDSCVLPSSVGATELIGPAGDVSHEDAASASIEA